MNKTWKKMLSLLAVLLLLTLPFAVPAEEAAQEAAPVEAAVTEAAEAEAAPAEEAAEAPAEAEAAEAAEETPAEESAPDPDEAKGIFVVVAKVNGFINNIVWGWPAMILILGVGLYLTLASKGLQFRRFGISMKETLGKIFDKKKAGEGSITPFQAVCTALAATVGTGNVAGVAGAIALGGPGAVFWMWISALLGMCTKYAEVVLAVRYRERNDKGEWVGGPMYYITNGLGKNWKWLAVLFALFGMLASFGIGNATQVSSIKDSINEAITGFGGSPSVVLNWILGILLALIVMVVHIGGLKRVASVTEKLVPFMAILYIILGLGVIAMNIGRIPAAFAAIFEGAFSPRAVTGGIVGSMLISMRRGISRGIFSNEAGLGSAPIAHASADVDHPVRQGMYGIFEVFADTIIICSLTALVVLCGVGAEGIAFGQPAGAALTIKGFTNSYGNWVTVFTAIAICCFAFSTIIGWGLYGSRCTEYLFGRKAIKPYLVLFSLMSILGATQNLGLLWDIADTLNGLMAIPNLVAVILLAPVVFKLAKEFFSKGSQPDLTK